MQFEPVQSEMVTRLLPIYYREMENVMWYPRMSFMLNNILNFNILAYLVAVFDLNLNFSNFPIVTGKKWCGSMCMFGCGTNLSMELSQIFCSETVYSLIIWLFSLEWHLEMALISKPLKHTMPDSDKEVQDNIEAWTGVWPCLWQVKVLCKILK